MKTCNTCHIEKPESAYYFRCGPNSKKRPRCKACENAARDLRRRANLKADSAKVLAAYGVRTGVIKKQTICSDCGEEKPLQKHHENYSKPYQVIWLCQQCHSRLHSAKKRGVA